MSAEMEKQAPKGNISKWFFLKENLSIPNAISLMRLVMIPFILIVYLDKRVILAAILVIISGISDFADGFIARRFNQITPLGKVLDPMADKLTQIVVAAGLCVTYTAILPLFAVLLVKEMLMMTLSFRLMRHGMEPIGAYWWGKVSTSAFYVGIAVIMLFGAKIPSWIVTGISIIVTLLLLYSMWRYFRVYCNIKSKYIPSKTKTDSTSESETGKE